VTCAGVASVLRRLQRTARITAVGEGGIERRQRLVWRGNNWVRKEHGESGRVDRASREKRCAYLCGWRTEMSE
jgi:hypothetical protein